MLNQYAYHRFFFEEDTIFPDLAKKIIPGYNHAARKAAIHARKAASKGDIESILTAQYWETVTRTIEECLHVLVRDKDDFSEPELPNFEVFKKHYEEQ